MSAWCHFVHRIIKSTHYCRTIVKSGRGVISIAWLCKCDWKCIQLELAQTKVYHLVRRDRIHTLINYGFFIFLQVCCIYYSLLSILMLAEPTPEKSLMSTQWVPPFRVFYTYIYRFDDHWFIILSGDWMNDQLMIEQSIDWLSDLFIHCKTEWPIEWLTDWLIDRFNQCLLDNDAKFSFPRWWERTALRLLSAFFNCAYLFAWLRLKSLFASDWNHAKTLIKEGIINNEAWESPNCVSNLLSKSIVQTNYSVSQVLDFLNDSTWPAIYCVGALIGTIILHLIHFGFFKLRLLMYSGCRSQPIDNSNWESANPVRKE